MTMQMRTRTPYDFPHLEELQRVSAKSFAKKMSVGLRTFLLAAGILDLGVGLYSAINLNSPFMTLFLSVMGALLLAWYIFFYTIRAWSVGKALGDPDFCNEFVFEEEHLVVYVNDQKTEIPYTQCVMLLEADLCFYMILPNKQGMMLDKTNLKNGTDDELRVFLEKACGMPAKWVGKGRKTK